MILTPRFLITCRRSRNRVDRFALFYRYYPRHRQYEVDDPHRPTRDWRHSCRVLQLLYIYLVASVTLSLFIIITWDVPSFVATGWSALLALIALIASSIQFIPQIIRTWKLKVCSQNIVAH
jgi:hypothetical protein